MNLLNSSPEIVIVLVARLCLGFFLFPSALGKLTNQRGFIQGMVDYQILPERTAKVFGLILPWIELGLALALILGIALPIAATVASLLLMSFTAAVTINLQRGHEIMCNCYGIAGTKTISWGTVVRNVLLLLLAAVVVSLAPQNVALAPWLPLWGPDFFSISSIEAAILITLLLLFCFVVIYLSEWAVDIYYRISHLISSKSE